LKTSSLLSKLSTNLCPLILSIWLNPYKPQMEPKSLISTNWNPLTVTKDNFKEFLQNVEVYMDVNNDLRKIAFVLSFMTTGAAATWKAQFIDNAYSKPIPANLNDRLGTYAQFRKDLLEAFSMFDSVGDVLDELRSLRKKKMESIDEHIAKFKMLATESKIDTTNPLTIELFKETLPWGLTLQLMKLETLIRHDHAKARICAFCLLNPAKICKTN
jgi:hypothetical protein